MDWPFLGAEALAAGVIPQRAMHVLYEPVYPGVYGPAGVEPSAIQQARAAWLWSPRRGVVAGNSAAALLGAKWVSPKLAAELVHGNRRPPPRIIVHSDGLTPRESTTVDGIAVTGPARTVFDIGRRTVNRLQAVQRLDALAHATDVKTADVEAVIAAHAGARGLVRLRQVLPLVDGGAESPQETRTRLVLIDAGLPKPPTQVVVCNDHGDFVARIDMGYRELRIGIEYDGPQHWTGPEQIARDIDRHVALADLGWTIVRVTSDLLRYREATFVGRVVTAMQAAGWDGDPRTWIPRRDIGVSRRGIHTRRNGGRQASGVEVDRHERGGRV